MIQLRCVSCVVNTLADGQSHIFQDRKDGESFFFWFFFLFFKHRETCLTDVIDANVSIVYVRGPLEKLYAVRETTSRC
jgi:hypothetical protein